MSSAAVPVSLPAAPGDDGRAIWRMRGRQLAAVVLLEARRNLASRQSTGLYTVGLLPLVPLLVFMGMVGRAPQLAIAEIPSVYAELYEGTFLPFLVFFSCASLFADLFRRDITDRSLHYWLLAPVRRELLAVGRYLSALVSVSIVFTTSTVVGYVSFYVHHGWGLVFRHVGSALPDLGAYVLVTLLGVMSYGALFFLVGLYFESPILPALGIWMWESINNLLPSFLKGFSLIHYLKAPLPIRLSEGIFSLSGDPASPWVAIPGLLLFTALCLGAAVLKVRTIEAAYGAE